MGERLDRGEVEEILAAVALPGLIFLETDLTRLGVIGAPEADAASHEQRVDAPVVSGRYDLP